MNTPASPSAEVDHGDADSGGALELKAVDKAAAAAVEVGVGDEGVEMEAEKKVAEEGDRPMDTGDEFPASPATVFRIRLKQPPSNLRHKMRVPELCRNFRLVSSSSLLLPVVSRIRKPWSSVAVRVYCFCFVILVRKEIVETDGVSIVASMR